MYREVEQPAKSVAEPRLLLTEPEAADLLQISSRSLFGLRKSGKLGYVPYGRTGIRYTRDQLEAWIKANRKDATNGPN